MELEKGITRNGEGFGGVRWNILGQTYFPKAVCDSAFAFEANSDPGQFVPVHVHPTQDEFILVQEGELSLKLDGVWSIAKAGDLVRMPRGIPHGYFNKVRQAGPGALLGFPARKARGSVQGAGRTGRCARSSSALCAARRRLSSAGGERVAAHGAAVGPQSARSGRVSQSWSGPRYTPSP
jgi:Cupin domain